MSLRHACGLALLLVGCAGSPPTITNLHSDVDVVPLGETSRIAGTFDFRDPDADLEWLNIEHVDPAGETHAPPRSELQGATVEQGTITWALFLEPQLAGTYTYEIWVTDSDGSPSNRLSGTFEAGTPVLPCETSMDNCHCYAAASGSASVCSEASVGGGVCCQTESSCNCTAQACARDDILDWCQCGARTLVMATGGTEVASCTPPSGGHCCRRASTTVSGSGSCDCTSESCGFGETEVASCDLAAVEDCGADTHVTSCR